MSSGKDFIPGPDELFDSFLKAFFDAVNGNPNGFGLTATDVALIQTAYNAWTTAFAAHKDAQLAAHKAATTKDKTRGEAETATRGLVKKINGNPNVDNEMRAKAALPSHDTVRTAIAAPATRPIGRLEVRSNHTIAIHIVDETTPHQTAKPHGVHAAEIRLHVGDPQPTDENGYTFLVHATRALYLDPHAAADAGKTAYYVIRWLNDKLEPGPWSDAVSAKIPV